MRSTHVLWFGLLVAIVIVRLSSAWSAEPVILAEDGRPLLPVVLASNASESLKQAAADLASRLSKMVGARFEVAEGDGSSGIAVGLPGQFPHSPWSGKWSSPSVDEREDYVMRSHHRGVWLLGATDGAAVHAVWDFLFRLGYRQFFPGERWEVIPRLRELAVTLDEQSSPSYRSRRIWYGFGAWDHAGQPYADWCVRNRMGGGIELRTGHAYDGIVRATKREFEAHSEYWPLLDGQRRPVSNPKPCLGNPEVRALFIKHALAEFAADPSLDSVSMDPSDGGGWCQCERCAKLGTVSDQAVTVANEVAAAVASKYPDKYVGMYAYNYHSPPPNVQVHPQVIVSAATAFIKGGLSFEEMISGWSARGATLGIREYYSVNTWDRDQPADARGGNLEYLRRTIPQFYSQGARFLSAESSDNWGPNGLGYYLASRLLWDVREAQRMEELVEDFLVRAFGPAREPMREFYRQLDGSKPHLVINDQLGRMYRSLDQAWALADSPEVRARINDLTLYARYCTLYRRYAAASGGDRQRAFESLIRHAYRMRKTMLVHAYALYRDLDNRDKSVSIPDEAKWQVPEGQNPWKTSEPFGESELAGFRQEGIQSHPLVELDFQPVSYSNDLVPAASHIRLPELPAGELGPGRGTQEFHTYFETGPATLELQVTGGLIPHYRDRGNVKIGLFKVGGSSATGQRETPIAEDRSVPPDGTERTVRLTVTEAGLYRVTISDGQDKTLVKWPVGQPMTVVSTETVPMNGTYGQWAQYFYVPRGTQVIGMYGGEHGEIRDSQDRPQFWFNGRERGFYRVPVPSGEDGNLWRIRYMRGPLILLTVPSNFAATPQELLLPREVVERDR